jgi:hypothetical protein
MPGETWYRGASYRRHDELGGGEYEGCLVEVEAAGTRNGDSRAMGRDWERGETGAYVCGVVWCWSGVVVEIWGTLAATPCAMQRGSLAGNTPVVVSFLARPHGASVISNMYSNEGLQVHV